MQFLTEHSQYSLIENVAIFHIKLQFSSNMQMYYKKNCINTGMGQVFLRKNHNKGPDPRKF